MAEQPLTPLEFVELGNRLTEDRVEELGLTRLIEDARTVVRAGLRTMKSGLEVLGADVRGVKKHLLGKPFWRWDRYASNPLTKKRGGDARTKLIPEQLSVVEGPSNPGSNRRKAKAVVLEKRWRRNGRILVLGDDNPKLVYPNWTGASKVVLGYGDPNYWDLGGPKKINPDNPLL